MAYLGQNNQIPTFLDLLDMWLAEKQFPNISLIRKPYLYMLMYTPQSKVEYIPSYGEITEWIGAASAGLPSDQTMVLRQRCMVHEAVDPRYTFHNQDEYVRLRLADPDLFVKLETHLKIVTSYLDEVIDEKLKYFEPKAGQEWTHWAVRPEYTRLRSDKEKDEAREAITKRFTDPVKINWLLGMLHDPIIDRDKIPSKFHWPGRAQC